MNGMNNRLKEFSIVRGALHRCVQCGWLFCIILLVVAVGAQAQLDTQVRSLTLTTAMQLPDRWTAFEVLAPVDSNQPFLEYGPYSLAISVDIGIFLPDDNTHTIVLVDWKGNVQKEYSDAAKQYQGNFSDIAYKDNIIYAGCADQASILTFNVKTGEVIQRINLPQGVQRNMIGQGSGAMPVVCRLGVDNLGSIHVLYKKVLQNDAKQIEVFSLATINKEGQLLRDQVVEAIPQGSARLERGSLGFGDEWFFPLGIPTLLDDQETRLGRAELWMINAKGESLKYDGLEDFFEEFRGTASEILGVDDSGTLYAYVGLYIDPRINSPKMGSYLISWSPNNQPRKMIGKVDRAKSVRRAIGSRQSVVTDDGTVYILQLKAVPHKPGDKVNLILNKVTKAETAR